MGESELAKSYAERSKHSGLVVLCGGDARQLVDDAEKQGVYVLGIDSFHLAGSQIEPDLAMDSASFPAGRGWEAARQHLDEREGLGLHFEVVLSDDSPGPSPFLIPTLDRSGNKLVATWTNEGDATTEQATLSVIAPHGSDLTDANGERVHSQVYDRWGRYFYLGKVTIAPGEGVDRELAIQVPPGEEQRIALWSSVGARQSFDLDPAA